MAANEPNDQNQPVFDLKQYQQSVKQHREYSRQVQESASNPLLDSVNLVAATRKQVDKVTSQAEKAIKAHYQDPFKLVTFIQEKGTPVYVLPAGLRSFILRLAIFALGVELGFVPPPENDHRFGQQRYHLLQKLLIKGYGPKPGLTFNHGVFILPTRLFNVGFIAHQLHHWLACMAGLPGYGEDAQAEYKKFMTRYGGVVGPDHDSMSEEEIVNLRNAIHREIEALAFLKNVTEELFRPLRQARNIHSGTANA